MDAPKGAKFLPDGGVGIRPTMMLPVLTVVVIVLFAFMAIGIPLDQAREGRMNAGIITFSIVFGLVALIALWYLIFQSRRPTLRVDDAGIHRLRPYAKMAWQDISAIKPNPLPRGSFSIELPEGWVKKDGSRSKQKRMIIRSNYLQDGRAAWAYMVDRWNAAHGVGGSTPT